MIAWLNKTGPLFISGLAVMLGALLYAALKNFKMAQKLKAGSNQPYRLPQKFNLMAAVEAFSRHKKIYMAVLALSFMLLFYTVFGHWVFSAILAVCLSVAVNEFMANIRRKNHHALHEQAISFISYMILMLRAKKTIRQIFKSYLDHSQKPLKTYLEIMVNELEFNLSLNQALDNFSNRCCTREIRLLSSALKINDRIGGNLIFVLENISDSLKQSLQVKSKSDTLTFQSRFSAIIISLFPIAALAGLYFFMGSTVKDFFELQVSNIVLIVGGLLEIAGIITIKKILGASQ
jgi:tight adherence protein B